MVSCRVRLAVFLCSMMISPALAHAQAPNSTCDMAAFLMLGQSTSATIGATPNNNLYYKFRAELGRSYVVLAWSAQTNMDLQVNLYRGCDKTPTENSDFAVTNLMTTDQVRAGSRTFIAAEDQNVWVEIVNGRGATDLTVLGTETTLVSPWWFTGGSNQAYIEIRSNLPYPAFQSVHYEIVGPNGVRCFETDVKMFGGSNTAIAINGILECSHLISGSAVLTFRGLPGSYAANLTTIDVVNGTSFDSPFVARLPISPSSR